jgi:putative ABC transport system permease protein
MKLTGLKVAFRYFISADRYSLLNIIGLTIGVTLFVLMVMLLNYELSYDSFSPTEKQILQVCQLDLKSGEKAGYCPVPMSHTLKADFPETRYVTSIWHTVNKEAKVKYEDREYSGFDGASAEPDLFDMFGIKIILGDKATALADFDKIAISKSTAEKIFGKENPVGKILTITGFNLTVSHVYNDLPQNTSLRFDMLFSDKVREKLNPDYKVAWWAGGIKTYVILQNGYSIAEFDKHLKEIPSRYYPDFLKGRSTYFTVPFFRSHFNTSLRGQSAVSYTYIILLGCISLVILLIASINYVNLTMARAFRMNIDAGIRRISGAGSAHIIGIQIWISVLNVITALILAMPLSSLIMPVFEKLSERPLAWQENNLEVWLFTCCTTLIVGIISGFLPGKLFSKVETVSVLKSKNSFVRTNRYIHNSLIVFQFTLSLVLIIAQLFIFRQITFMKNADLGYNNNNLIALQLAHLDLPYVEKYNKAIILKDEIEKKGVSAGIIAGSITEDIPGYYFENSFTANLENSAVDECLVTSTSIDEDFLKVFGIDVVEGRYFSDSYSTDHDAFIINETARKKFGWENIEGRYLKFPFEDGKYPVVGVMKDIHPTTLKEPIPPMVYRFRQHNNFPAFLTFRINTPDQRQLTDIITKEWKIMFPNETLKFINVKEEYFKNYIEEQRLSKIIGIFSVLAILLSLLGLFGLIAFYFERRVKEIGIRKINGARVTQILAMLNKDFVLWIAAAFLVACPVAAYFMHNWLKTFAYKVQLSWWVFALAGIFILAITLLTVSWQSWRAATRNPVEALRYE